MSFEHVAEFSLAATPLNGPSQIKFNGSTELAWIQAKLTTSATVGNRTLAMQVVAANGTTVLYEKQQSLVVAASKTGVVFSFYPGSAPEKVTDLFSDVPIPGALTVPTGGFVRIVDKSAVSVATDTISMEIQAVPA